MDVAAADPAKTVTTARNDGPDPGVVALIGVGLTPFLFAISTWDPQQSGNPFLFDLRRFSAPVLAIELGVVILAMARGLSFGRVLGSLALPTRTLLAVIVCVATLGALVIAPVRPDAIMRTAMTFLHLLFGFAATHLIGTLDPRQRRFIWPAVVVGICLYGLMVPAFILARPETFDWRYFGLGVINIRHVGYYSAVGCAVALGLAAGSARNRTWLVWSIAAAACFALACWSGTRGALAALGGGLIVGALVIPGMASRRALTAATVAAILGAAASLLFDPADPHLGLVRMSSSLAGTGADQLSSGRIAIWLDTARHIAERPWFGHGDGQFRTLVAAGNGQFNHPHNAVLQVLLQWGIIGSVCLAVLFAMMIRRALINQRDNPNAAPAFLLLFCLLAYALIDGTLYYPYPVMMIALAFAFLLAPAAPAPATATARPE